MIIYLILGMATTKAVLAERRSDPAKVFGSGPKRHVGPSRRSHHGQADANQRRRPARSGGTSQRRTETRGKIGGHCTANQKSGPSPQTESHDVVRAADCQRSEADHSFHRSWRFSRRLVLLRGYVRWQRRFDERHFGCGTGNDINVDGGRQPDGRLERQEERQRKEDQQVWPILILLFACLAPMAKNFYWLLLQWRLKQIMNGSLVIIYLLCFE